MLDLQCNENRKCCIKTNNEYHTVVAIPKSNIKIVERGKIVTSNTQIHVRSLSWFLIGTSVINDAVKLVLV